MIFSLHCVEGEEILTTVKPTLRLRAQFYQLHLTSIQGLLEEYEIFYKMFRWCAGLNSSVVCLKEIAFLSF